MNYDLLIDGMDYVFNQGRYEDISDEIAELMVENLYGD